MWKLSAQDICQLSAIQGPGCDAPADQDPANFVVPPDGWSLPSTAPEVLAAFRVLADPDRHARRARRRGRKTATRCASRSPPASPTTRHAPAASRSTSRARVSSTPTTRRSCTRSSRVVSRASRRRTRSSPSAVRVDGVWRAARRYACGLTALAGSVCRLPIALPTTTTPAVALHIHVHHVDIDEHDVDEHDDDAEPESDHDHRSPGHDHHATLTPPTGGIQVFRCDTGAGYAGRVISTKRGIAVQLGLVIALITVGLCTAGTECRGRSGLSALVHRAAERRLVPTRRRPSARVRRTANTASPSNRSHPTRANSASNSCGDSRRTTATSISSRWTSTGRRSSPKPAGSCRGRRTRPEQASEGVIPAVLKTGRYQGRMYAAPLNTGSQLLWYRKDLVPNPPTTWDEMFEDGRANFRRVERAIEVQATRYEGYTVWFNSLLASAGGSILTSTARSSLAPQADAGCAARSCTTSRPSPGRDPSLSNNTEDEARPRVPGRHGGLPGELPVRVPGGEGRGAEDLRQHGRGALAAGQPRRARARHARRVQPRRRQVRRPPEPRVRGGALPRAARSPGGVRGEGRSAADQRVPCTRTRGSVKAYPFADLLLETFKEGSTRPVSPAYNDISLAVQRTLHPPSSINPKSDVDALRSRVDDAINSARARYDHGHRTAAARRAPGRRAAGPARPRRRGDRPRRSARAVRSDASAGSCAHPPPS